MTGNSYDIPGILKGLTEEKRDKCTAVQEGGHFMAFLSDLRRFYGTGEKNPAGQSLEEF